MPGTFSPSPQVSDPVMHHGTCVTHVPWCMPGSLTSGFLRNRRPGKTFPAFPAHAQPAILRIWQVAHVLMITSLALVQCQCNNHVNPTYLLSNMRNFNYSDVLMSAMAFQFTSLTIVYSNVYAGRSKKTWSLRVTGLCEGNSPVTANAENVSIWWLHHVLRLFREFIFWAVSYTYHHRASCHTMLYSTVL